jgi:hypothetical protein
MFVDQRGVEQVDLQILLHCIQVFPSRFAVFFSVLLERSLLSPASHQDGLVRRFPKTGIS